MSNKVVSFSLWGDDPKYWVGAERNAELIKDIYPGWQAWFYTHQNNARFEEYQDKLTSMGAKVIPMTFEASTWEGLFWRFFAIDDPEVDIAIFRDTDSRLNIRERACVDEWINSRIPFHVMRDHKYHNTPILGGMWGTRSKVFNMKTMFKVWPETNKKGSDQRMLAAKVWPLAMDIHLAHDERFSYSGSHAKPFPKTDPIPGGFVGAIFDESDNPEKIP